MGRPLGSLSGDRAPSSFLYDGFGRLAEVTEDDGVAPRTSLFGYDAASGYLGSVSDPLGRLWGYGRDGGGRVEAITRPDSEVIGFSYDGSGNVTSVTPPGRSAHLFDYTAMDQMEVYDPPAVGGDPMPVSYSYTLDHDLETEHRADGTTIDFDYEPGTGRLSSITSILGTTTLTYDDEGDPKTTRPQRPPDPG